MLKQIFDFFITVFIVAIYFCLFEGIFLEINSFNQFIKYFLANYFILGVILSVFSIFYICMPKKYALVKSIFNYTCLIITIISSFFIRHAHDLFRRYQDELDFTPFKGLLYYFVVFLGLLLCAIAVYKVIGLLRSLDDKKLVFKSLLFSSIFLWLLLFSIENYFHLKKAPLLANTNRTEVDNYNVIIFLSDALRADYMSIYGNPIDTTPFMKEQFENNNATVFKRVTSLATSTAPSVAAILSSISPITNLEGTSPDIKFLPGILNSYGYRTFGISSNPLFNKNDSGRAFEFFVEDRIDPVFRSSLIYIIGKALPSLGFPSLSGFYHRGIRSMKEETFKWMDQHQTENFFIFFHAMETHTPYLPPPFYMFELGFNYLDGYKDVMAYFEGIENVADKDKNLFNYNHLDKEVIANYTNRYRASIRYTDDIVSSFFAKLKELGLLHKTIFIFTSDHGDAFLEKGYHPIYLAHHQANPYQELFNVPLIFWLPAENKFQKGSEEYLATSLDITPTILDLLGISILKDMEGKSLFNNSFRDLQRKVVIDIKGFPWRIGRFGFKKLILFKHENEINYGFWTLNYEKKGFRIPILNKQKFFSLIQSEELKLYKSLIEKLEGSFKLGSLPRNYFFLENHKIEYVYLNFGEQVPKLKNMFPNGLVMFSFNQIKDFNSSLFLNVNNSSENVENLIHKASSTWPKQLITNLLNSVLLIPGYYEFYDLENDPKENQNLLILNENTAFLEDVYEMAGKMNSIYEKLKIKSKKFRGGKMKVYSKEETDRLKALGYLN